MAILDEERVSFLCSFCLLQILIVLSITVESISQVPQTMLSRAKTLHRGSFVYC